LCKDFAENHCQKSFNNNLGFSDGFHSASDSINSSRWAVLAGKNPLYKQGIGGLCILKTPIILETPLVIIRRINSVFKN
jgi:hypothetical protein